MKIGDRIEAEMIRREWSEGELARRSGVPQPTIHRIIKSESKNPRQENIQAIARVLGCSSDWLWYGTGKAPEGAAQAETEPASNAIDKVRQMLEKVGNRLPTEARAQILQAAEQDVAAATKTSNVIPADFSRNHPRKGELLIPQFDIRASLGAGQVPTDYVETVRNVIVNEAHLQALGIKYTAVENISLVTGWGDSMEGTINDKDPVMIDHGVKEFIGDGLYLLTWLDHLYIKRVAVMDAEHFKLKSDNEKYDPQVARIDDVTIHARVLLIWNTRKA